MKIVRSIIASTHVDQHGDALTKELLEEAAAQVRLNYIPMLKNHDPRIPLLGRMVNAEVTKLPDGHFALVATSEVFESSDKIEIKKDDKEIILRTFDQNKITIVSDRSYRNSHDQEVLQELSCLPEIKIEAKEKKAIEPISILLIALSASLAAFTSGFLNKMGADVWDYLKPRISRLLTKKRKEKKEYLFIFELQTFKETGLLSIQCIITSPKEKELLEFYSKGFELLNSLLPNLLDLDPDIRKVVLLYKNGNLVPSYAIRKDCIPVILNLNGLKKTDV